MIPHAVSNVASERGGVRYQNPQPDGVRLAKVSLVTA